MHKQAELLTSKEAAARLGRDRSTVSRLVSAGLLTPALRGSGANGEMFFHADDVEQLLAERTARKTPSNA